MVALLAVPLYYKNDSHEYQSIKRNQAQSNRYDHEAAKDRSTQKYIRAQAGGTGAYFIPKR
jgi:hypothetical protein